MQAAPLGLQNRCGADIPIGLHSEQLSWLRFSTIRVYDLDSSLVNTSTCTLLRKTACVLGALSIAGIAVSGVAAADDPNAVPPALLNTQCSLDQLMAATKVADPIAYGAIVEKYNSEPRWIQGGVVYHMNLLLQKPAAERQAEVDQLADVFPVYMQLFRTQESTANEVAAKCPSFPAEDPTVWNLAP